MIPPDVNVLIYIINELETAETTEYIEELAETLDIEIEHWQRFRDKLC